MKNVILVCQGMADEELEALSGRTPLEVAKTPNCDALAKKGRLARASFVPNALPAGADVAAMSILGFDPQAFYTGLAPLEAIAMGLEQTDRAIAFRCNLVSVLDEGLIDAYSGNISATESTILIKALNEKLSNDRIRFYSGKGFRNILIVNDAELCNDLDDLECAPPEAVVGKKIVKYLPKGQGAQSIHDLMKSAKEILWNHEINKVRIDLQENPANWIWLWGQGKKPKIPAFKQCYGLEGSIMASGFVALQGLGKALQLETAQSLESSIEKNDFIFIFHSMVEGQKMELTSKIKAIEEFDSGVVGPVVKKLKNVEHRICVTTDAVFQISKRTVVHGTVPVLFEGQGIQSTGALLFNEKAASDSKQIFNKGHKMAAYLLQQTK